MDACEMIAEHDLTLDSVKKGDFGPYSKRTLWKDETDMGDLILVGDGYCWLRTAAHLIASNSD